MSKTNVKYLSKDFYVNPEKKTVVCKLKFSINCSNIAIYEKLLSYDSNFINDVYKWFDNHNITVDYSYFGYDIIVTGKAVCDNVDEFDETFGKHLSLTRAQQKAFAIAEEFYAFMYRYIANNQLKQLWDLENGCTEALSSVFEHEANMHLNH